MMKKVIIGFMMFVCVTSFAQKIKIKKNKINIDEIEVGILDKQKTVYKINSLDNRPIFSIERKMTLLLDGSTVYWGFLTDLNTNKTNEILDYGNDQGLSFERAIIASVCNDKYKFISTAGIDEKGVADFINGTPTDIEKVFAEANLKTKNQLIAENEAMQKSKISVKNGDIVQLQNINGKDTEVVIGSVIKKSETFVAGFAPSIVYNVNSIYTEIDNNNREQRRMKEVGNWYATKTGYNNPDTGKNIKNEIITSDNKYFKLRGGLATMEVVSSAGLEKGDLEFYTSDNLLPGRIVSKLLYNGVKFEAMK